MTSSASPSALGPAVFWWQATDPSFSMVSQSCGMKMTLSKLMQSWPRSSSETWPAQTNLPSALLDGCCPLRLCGNGNNPPENDGSLRQLYGTSTTLSGHPLNLSNEIGRAH